jgi:hypothetical protein
MLLHQLVAQVPDFHRLTDEQRAILIAVKRDTDLGKPGLAACGSVRLRFRECLALTINLRACSESTQGLNHAISTAVTKRSGGSTRYRPE